MKIEDYGFIGDTQTAALVGRNGSIDWLCFPRFDSAACFAALLGTRENGRWQIAPAAGVVATTRRYRDDSLIIETDFCTDTGSVRVIDFMPPRGTEPDVVRIVEGLEGEVCMRMELFIRFDYGSIVPWVRKRNGCLEAIAGPDALVLRTPVAHRGENLHTVADFTVKAGERVPFVLTWFPSHLPQPPAIDSERALTDTEQFWHEWAGRCTYQGEWRNEVLRSLITLKGLTYAPTGGIVAAATTSLPEQLGGVRNWDYRFCWLRDSTFTLYAFLTAGFTEEAAAWRDWLLRAVAGSASQLQMLYGPAGERRLEEFEVPWLQGYEKSAPVRIGNAAAKQFQLDVYGEVMDTFHLARRSGVPSDRTVWRLQRWLMRFVEDHWHEPDEGIWEVRGPRRQFTHSKMMAWLAADRAVKAVEQFGLDGDARRWRALRAKIHAEVCENGFNRDRQAFTQYYGASELDASLLMMPLVGFLPAHDPRVRGTIEAIERELVTDGFVLRYHPADAPGVDGLPSGEGTFLPCSFWFADCLHLLGRKEQAREVFQRLLAIQNDLGLLSEEYDTRVGRQVGNFPQAFSHIGLVNTAFALGASPETRSAMRSGPGEECRPGLSHEHGQVE
jgi:GH15 family glucan-1,4-alpha-glucosidase